MSLTKELKIQTFVLLVKKPAEFKPSEFNQYWLDINKIIPAKSLNKLSTFSPIVVEAISEKVTVIVNQNQIQVAPTLPEFFKEIITMNTSTLVKQMEDIELSGMGLNFNWFLINDKIPSEEFTKKYFCNNSNPVSKFFDDGRPMFGNYLSKDIDSNIRLKLDIKPVILNDVKENKSINTIQFAFNFHSDLKSGKQKELILKILTEYDKWHLMTSDIMKLF